MSDPIVASAALGSRHGNSRTSAGIPPATRVGSLPRFLLDQNRKQSKSDPGQARGDSFFPEGWHPSNKEIEHIPIHIGDEILEGDATHRCTISGHKDVVLDGKRDPQEFNPRELFPDPLSKRDFALATFFAIISESNPKVVTKAL